MKRLVLSALMMLCMSQAFALGHVSGKVIAVRIDKTGIGMVVFGQTVTGEVAACRHAAYTNALSFDTNTPAGRKVHQKKQPE
jgi:hypothetical protein